MFDRLSGESHRALEEARAEAGRLGHDFVGTEHVLLGVLDVGDQVAGALLARRGVLGETVRSQVARAGARQQAPSGLPPLSLTARAKQVMALAGREADDLGSSSVGPAHLLLGIIRQGTGVAALVLQDLGVDLVSLRDDLLAALTGDVRGDVLDGGDFGRDDVVSRDARVADAAGETGMGLDGGGTVTGEDAGESWTGTGEGGGEKWTGTGEDSGETWTGTGEGGARLAARVTPPTCPRCDRPLADHLLVTEIPTLRPEPADSSPGRLSRRTVEAAPARLSRRAVRSGGAPVVVVSCGACGYPLSVSR